MTAIAERFAQETATHEMSVLRDDDLYRHLRFKRPDSTMYYFDIVTWPGYLAIVGDCGDYVFSRIRDMFAFFAGAERHRDGINPDYWSEKLQAPRMDKARTFSHDAFRDRLMEWAESECEDYGYGDLLPYPSLVREAIEREVFHSCDLSWDGATVRYVGYERRYHDEHEAREVLAKLADQDLVFDTWEWDLREFDWQFLWCCHAIVWGIAQYRSAAQVAA